MPVSTLSLLPSSPSMNRKTIASDVLDGLVPILVTNGCSEDGCSIQSDDTSLTNIIRRHYLEHFGRRDLDGVVADYDESAFLINNINGDRKKFHGQDGIRMAFQDIFEMHPATHSSFLLKHIFVDRLHAKVTWTAKTETHEFPDSTDTFVFNGQGKIIKQVYMGEMNEVDHPW